MLVFCKLTPIFCLFVACVLFVLKLSAISCQFFCPFNNSLLFNAASWDIERKHPYGALHIWSCFSFGEGPFVFGLFPSRTASPYLEPLRSGAISQGLEQDPLYLEREFSYLNRTLRTWCCSYLDLCFLI